MTSTSTSAEGWHARATPHPDASTFQPTSDALIFASILSTMASPDSFTMALFRPNIAVDASGRILQLQPQDLSILALLAEDVARLPDTGAFQGFWVVSSRFTCRANDFLHVKTPEGGLKTTGVYAWDARHTELSMPTAGYEHLPPAMHELVGYAQEAHAEKTESKGGSELVQRIKDMVRDWSEYGALYPHKMVNDFQNTGVRSTIKLVGRAAVAALACIVCSTTTSAPIS